MGLFILEVESVKTGDVSSVEWSLVGGNPFTAAILTDLFGIYYCYQRL